MARPVHHGRHGRGAARPATRRSSPPSRTSHTTAAVRRSVVRRGEHRLRVRARSDGRGQRAGDHRRGPLDRVDPRACVPPPAGPGQDLAHGGRGGGGPGGDPRRKHRTRRPRWRPARAGRRHVLRRLPDGFSGGAARRHDAGDRDRGGGGGGRGRDRRRRRLDRLERPAPARAPRDRDPSDLAHADHPRDASRAGPGGEPRRAPRDAPRSALGLGSDRRAPLGRRVGRRDPGGRRRDDPLGARPARRPGRGGRA